MTIVDTRLWDYIIELDALTTSEFCRKFNVPFPKFFPNDTEKSALSLMQTDAIKCSMITEFAKKIKSHSLLSSKSQFQEKDSIMYCKCGKEAIELRPKEFLCSGITVPHGCSYSTSAG